MAKQTFTTGQVLTASQLTSLQQTAMQGGAASAKTASYTLVAADAGTAISMSNASATTITVNTALFAAGDTVYITNLGAGVCTITAGTATVNSSASLALAQYESGFLDFTSTSAAIFVKGAGAAAASGSMTLLSTTTLAGTVTTVSSINQTYKDLLVTVSNATWDTSDDAIAFYTNLSSVTSFVKLSNSAVTATNLSTNVGDFSDGVQNYLRTGGNNFTSLYIQDYSATSRYKNFQGYSIYQGTTNNGRRACLIG
ncbi:MAG: hypothetical protein EBS18_05270, partial [Actinobacteria bacterium]|nr:hypothetical protein [Actinomycetota bacterium]